MKAVRRSSSAENILPMQPFTGNQARSCASATPCTRRSCTSPTRKPSARSTTGRNRSLASVSATWSVPAESSGAASSAVREQVAHGQRAVVRGIHQPDVRPGQPRDGVLQQRVMRAAEDERVDARVQQRPEITGDVLVGQRVVEQPFLDQRHEQRARRRADLQAGREFAQGAFVRPAGRSSRACR